MSIVPELRAGSLALDVRRLSADIIEVPTDYIYSSDVVGELLAAVKSREDFSDRFSDFAMFPLPDDFEIAPTETVADVVRRLTALKTDLTL